MEGYDTSLLSSYNYPSLTSEFTQVSNVYLSSNSVSSSTFSSNSMRFDSISFDLMSSSPSQFLSFSIHTMSSFNPSIEYLSSSKNPDNHITIQISMKLIGESVASFTIEKQSRFLIAISTITKFTADKINFISITDDVNITGNIISRKLAQSALNLVYTIEAANSETANAIATLISDSVTNNELATYLNANGFNVYIILNEITLIGGDNTQITIPVVQPVADYGFLCDCNDITQCVVSVNEKCLLENFQLCLDCDATNQNYIETNCQTAMIETRNTLTCSEFTSNKTDDVDINKLEIIIPIAVALGFISLYFCIKFKKSHKINTFTNVVFSAANYKKPKNKNKNKSFVDASNNKIQPQP